MLLSIAMPTKDRPEYALMSIKQVLSQLSRDCELVVQDNSEGDDLQRSIESVSDDKLVYSRNKKPLSFVDNFSRAIDLCRGEYVCVVGDDDGVLPSLVLAARAAFASGVEVVFGRSYAVFLWPSASRITTKRAMEGQLTIEKWGNSLQLVNSRSSLKRWLNDGCPEYIRSDMARLYHGLVRKELLDQVRQKTGNYFGGLTPDIYAACALSSISKTVIATDFPMTLSGICPKSGSADSATGRHTGKLENAPHFRGHNTYRWNQLIPEIYSVETIWAETALHALDELGERSLIEQLNRRALTVRLLSMYPEFEPQLREYSEKNSLEWGEMAKEARDCRAKNEIKDLLRKMLSFTRPLRGITKISPISDVADAVDCVCDIQSAQSANFKELSSQMQEAIKKGSSVHDGKNFGTAK